MESSATVFRCLNSFHLFRNTEILTISHLPWIFDCTSPDDNKSLPFSDFRNSKGIWLRVSNVVFIYYILYQRIRFFHNPWKPSFISSCRIFGWYSISLSFTPCDVLHASLWSLVTKSTNDNFCLAYIAAATICLKCVLANFKLLKFQWHFQHLSRTTIRLLCDFSFLFALPCSNYHHCSSLAN